MIEIERIYPECYADTLLVQLIFDGGTPTHLFGISEVAKGLRDFPANDFIIGLIDTDKFKRDPSFIRQFTEEVENKLVGEGIIVLKIPDTNRYVARLHPAFEKWILNAAITCRIDLDKFGFDTLKKIITAAKNIGVAKDDNFRIFLTAIIQKNPPAIQTLRYWLSKAIAGI